MTREEVVERIERLLDPDPYDPPLTPSCMEALRIAMEDVKFVDDLSRHPVLFGKRG